ncbi:hypothetical protein [Paraburkholderia tropica]|uniref:hypothetical protein n=1 Tax=Paraburkholderia tropica TaxID=92647 RepID=UPI002AB74A79|nr:hypothetical protein [Paraburkholderia tropica]
MDDKSRIGCGTSLVLIPMMVFGVVVLFSLGLGISAALDSTFRSMLDNSDIPRWIGSILLMVISSVLIIVAWNRRKRSAGIFLFCCAATFFIAVILDVFDHHLAQRMNLF